MGTLFRGDLGSMIERTHDDCEFPDMLPPGSLDRCDGNLCGEFPAAIHDSIDGITGAKEGGIPVARDYFDGVYEYIKQMLMEEDDLERRPCMFQDCSALQAAEKYFHDALSDKDSTPVDSSNSPPCDVHVGDFLNSDNLEFGASGSSFGGEWSLVDPQIRGDGARNNGFLDSSCWSHFQVPKSSPAHRSSQPASQENGVEETGGFRLHFQDSMGRDLVSVEQRGGNECSTKDDFQRKKTQRDSDTVDVRSSKQLARYEEEEYGGMDKYDKAFLCHQMNPRFYEKPPISQYEETSEDELDTKYTKQPEVKRGRPKGTGKKQLTKPAAIKGFVDLRTLLTRCAAAVSSFNDCTAQDLLAQIRQHSSPYGDANERLAHCFANALEARMAGTGPMLYTAFASRRIPAAELLKSYQTYVTACPFKRMSNIFANKSIASCTLHADKIHIIDFGIWYGFQWPCIIQGISLRPGGPPRLKITGIDFPQPGFRPAERVEQTGRRLMSYCKRFNVPFQYNAIAKRWDEIRAEDLKIESDEMVVANCLYRLRHVPDEPAAVNRHSNSPRDAILELIRKINPALFVHGVVNGTYDTPFFASRFKETLFHYSSFFDLMEATIPREDQDRLLYEREVFGREVMNAVACEGAERIERPETYKQWQVRNQRAGFEPVALNREIVKEIKVKVRQGYHGDFLLEEDGEWMLQGWKGRVLYALTCWKPLEEGSWDGTRMR